MRIISLLVLCVFSISCATLGKKENKTELQELQILGLAYLKIPFKKSHITTTAYPAFSSEIRLLKREIKHNKINYKNLFKSKKKASRSFLWSSYILTVADRNQAVRLLNDEENASFLDFAKRASKNKVITSMEIGGDDKFHQFMKQADYITFRTYKDRPSEIVLYAKGKQLKVFNHSDYFVLDYQLESICWSADQKGKIVITDFSKDGIKKCIKPESVKVVLIKKVYDFE